MVETLRPKNGARQEPALALLEDPQHTLLTSPFVFLETVPKARHHGRQKEVEFYEEYFARAEWTRDLSTILQHGIEMPTAMASDPWTPFTSQPPSF